MKKIFIKKIEYKLPECWQDCDFEHLKKITLAYFTEKQNENQYIFLLKILGLFIPKKLIQKISPENLAKLCKILEWLTASTPSFDLTQIPQKKTYKGFVLPAHALSNITVSQYINAETYYIDFLKSQKIESLRKFVASLLTPTAWFWQDKNKFDDALPHLPQVEKLPQGFIWVMFLYFASCKEEIAKLYPILYQNDEGNSTQKTGSWVDIIFDVTETKVFGTLDEVGDTLIHNFLAFCQKKKKDFLNQKQQNEQSTNN